MPSRFRKVSVLGFPGRVFLHEALPVPFRQNVCKTSTRIVHVVFSDKSFRVGLPNGVGIRILWLFNIFKAEELEKRPGGGTSPAGFFHADSMFHHAASP